MTDFIVGDTVACYLCNLPEEPCVHAVGKMCYAVAPTAPNSYRLHWDGMQVNGGSGGGGLNACINRALAHTPQGSNQHHACTSTYSPADWARLPVHSSVQQVTATCQAMEDADAATGVTWRVAYSFGKQHGANQHGNGHQLWAWDATGRAQVPGGAATSRMGLLDTQHASEQLGQRYPDSGSIIHPMNAGGTLPIETGILHSKVELQFQNPNVVQPGSTRSVPTTITVPNVAKKCTEESDLHVSWMRQPNGCQTSTHGSGFCASFPYTFQGGVLDVSGRWDPARAGPNYSVQPVWAAALWRESTIMFWKLRFRGDVTPEWIAIAGRSSNQGKRLIGLGSPLLNYLTSAQNLTPLRLARLAPPAALAITAGDISLGLERGSIPFWRAACDFVYEELCELDATWEQQRGGAAAIYGDLPA